MNDRERGEPFSYKVTVEISDGSVQVIHGVVKAPNREKAVRRSLHDASIRYKRRRK